MESKAVRVRDTRAGSRLAVLASMVPTGSHVADIGCGHGLLARLLLEQRVARRCVASERTPALLARVRALPPHHPRAEDLELRAGDGLDVLHPADAIDAVVIAGMGSRKILALIDRSAWALRSIETWVLQPQTEPERLRAGLIARGLRLEDERLVEEHGRLYTVMAASPGPPALADHPRLSRADLIAAGPALLRRRDPLLRPLWTRERERLRNLVPRANGARRVRLAARLASAGRILAELEA